MFRQACVCRYVVESISFPIFSYIYRKPNPWRILSWQMGFGEQGIYNYVANLKLVA